MGASTDLVYEGSDSLTVGTRSLVEARASKILALRFSDRDELMLTFSGQLSYLVGMPARAVPGGGFARRPFV